MMDQEIRDYRRALRQFQRLVGAQMKSCSCSVSLPQCLILLELDEHGQMTMSQLAAALRLDHSTLSRTIEGLVRSKLVARLRDESDRRLVWVRLTDHGAATCAEIHRQNDAYCASVLDNIPPSKRTNVLQAFETLVHAYIEHEKTD
jgi:DNA-binding MarR family transcriptional regulator